VIGDGREELKRLKRLKELKELKRLNLENTDLIYGLLLSAIWVVFVFCLSSTHSCAPSAYTLAYPTVLTIVHLDSTSILSLYIIGCLYCIPALIDSS
jgi:hypothetical protein